jgi:hypothetical protein
MWIRTAQTDPEPDLGITQLKVPDHEWNFPSAPYPVPGPELEFSQFRIWFQKYTGIFPAPNPITTPEL